MAETDELYEFGWESGFSCLVYNPTDSQMLHMEVPLRCQLKPNAQKDSDFFKMFKIT